MRVLAVAFEDAHAARQALEELRRRYALAPDDVGVAPYAALEMPGPTAVLAGRFADELVADVRALLAGCGGHVVSEIDERWTQSPWSAEPLEAESRPAGP